MTTKKQFSVMNDGEKNAFKSKVVEELNSKLSDLGCKAIDEKRANQEVGVQGFDPGQTVTLTNIVEPVKVGDTVNFFLAIKTTTGENISLKHLIPISYASYSVGTFIDEIFIDDEKISEEVNATFEGKPEMLKQISDKNKAVLPALTKSDIILFGLIESGEVSFEGMKATFMGNAYRQTTAKKDYLFGEGEVKRGYKRAMKQAIWKFSKLPLKLRSIEKSILLNLITYL